MRKLAYKERGLSDFTFLFYFQRNAFIESLKVYTSQFRAHTENSHGIEKMMSQYCVQNEFHSLRTPHYCNVKSQGHQSSLSLSSSESLISFSRITVLLSGSCLVEMYALISSPCLFEA